MNKKFSWEGFLRIPVIGIIRNISLEDLVHILPLYQEAGLHTIEITMNSSDAREMIQYAVEKYGGHLNVGAGTVCNLNDLDKALKAGARFIVTPIVEEEVIKACKQQRIPVFPGAFTPTEIYKAWTLGASMVKVFPATEMGPRYIRDIKGPLNHIKLMPTGGVNIDNCVDFLKTGAEGLGMGSKLFNPADIRDKNWESVKEHFVKLVEKIKAFKNEMAARS